MFDLQCMEYLREISHDPQNTNLRSKLIELISKNPQLVEPFIEKFQLNPVQKQLLLELLQEVKNNSNNNTNNINLNDSNTIQSMREQSTQNNNSQSSISEMSSNDSQSLYDITFNYFTTWRDEYLKFQKVTQHCIEIAEEFIAKFLWNNQEQVELFQSLPTQHNDAFVKFKNHVINVLCVQLIEEVDREITLLKSSPISYLRKIVLIYKFEQFENRVRKKKISFTSLQMLQKQSLTLRNSGGSN
ncbi:MAG: hypothetical protein ACLFPL_01445 [Candidatus Nanoarchaeia archaeon]